MAAIQKAGRDLNPWYIGELTRPTRFQPILYSSVVSQWANVPHLGLVEKGFGKDEVEIKEVDLCR